MISPTVFDVISLQYFIGVYDSMNRVRKAYYNVCLNMLRERVAQQRKEIKAKSLELEDKLARQEEVRTGY